VTPPPLTCLSSSALVSNVPPSRPSGGVPSAFSLLSLVSRYRARAHQVRKHTCFGFLAASLINVMGALHTSSTWFIHTSLTCSILSPTWSILFLQAVPELTNPPLVVIFSYTTGCTYTP
jgi:hypothetical protein